MAIRNIIVHEVKKSAQGTDAVIVDRPKENAVDEHAEELSSNLTKLFQKTGLSTGSFSKPEDDDDPIPQFVNLLGKYFSDGVFSDFVKFSKAATKAFTVKLDGSTSSKGGYLWFNHYVHNNDHFLSVVLLRKKQGLSLSADLSLAGIEQLDMDKLHMAARINLSHWQGSKSKRYIAFRIGRDAKDVTDYFAEFIGCEEYTQSKQDTQNLVSVTTKYCQQNRFDDSKTEEIKEFVFQRCEEWLKDDSPVYLDSLSTMLDEQFKPENVGKFLEIAQSEPYYLSNEVALDKKSLRKLVRYSVTTKKMSISFDNDLLNQTVFYNSEENALTIKELPAKLRDQLIKDEQSS